MTELVVEPFVSFLVDRLANLLIEEGTILHGVSDQVEQMKNELQGMRGFLIDADAKREGNTSVQNWVAEIRELTYDAEDAIATFVVEVADRRRGGLHHVLKRYLCIFNEAIARRKVGLEIKVFNKKIDNLTRRRQTYGIQVQPTAALGESSTSKLETVRKLRRSYTHIVEDDVVALDDDVQLVVDHLVNKKTDRRVVAIWGMGGLGKTTLAKKVYKHTDVRRHFDCFAWAYISEQCKVREVLEEILINLLSPISSEQRQEIEKLKPNELAKKLHGVQSEKKCLVILDDIWQCEAWDFLRPSFPNTTNIAVGSKILLTTRRRDVALYVDQQCFLHELRHLTEEESWELFQKKVSPGRDGIEFRLSTEMILLGEKMVKHCGGLPLAIVVLGGLLATKYMLSEWEKLSTNIEYLSKEKSQGQIPVMDVLALSYLDLPYHLKACFLYLSFLPEDENIRPEKLVQMWMAEGFVSPRVEVERETMLDIGMSYLNELVQRCMIQVSQLTTCSQRVKFYRLHDLMREVCLSKAQEENFLKVMFIGGKTTPLLSTTIRRLVMYYSDNRPVGDPYQILEMCNHVRSCQFYFGNRLEPSEWRHIRSLLKRLKLLRVLSIEKATFSGEKEMLPKEIGNLSHLRYLSIRDSQFGELPSSIGNLGLLQTLDLRIRVIRGISIRGIRGIIRIRIPNVLWRLKELRHLYLPNFWMVTFSRSKLRLDDLSKLETLEGFDARKCDVSCFSKLTNLRKLRIIFALPEDLEVILNSSCLSNSNSLLEKSYFEISDIKTQEEQSLLRQLLRCRHLYELRLFSCGIAKFPDEISPNLTKLFLYEINLEEDPMPTLEKLPNLRLLFMFGSAYTGKEMVCSAPTPTPPSNQSGGSYGGFFQLKDISLYNLFSLEKWSVEEGAMPSLLELEIVDCHQLKEIPNGLKFVNTLQKLYIRGASEELKERVRKGGEDFHKIEHVPTITIF